MRFLSVTHNVRLVAAIGLVLLSGCGTSQVMNKGRPCPYISVFFATNHVSSLEEVELMARKALMKSGLNPPDSVSLTVNFVVGGPRAGCYLSFHDATNSMIYSVIVDTKGSVTKAYVGKPGRPNWKFGDPLPVVAPGSIFREVEPSEYVPKGEEYE
jgi:hypothetical protein